MQKIDVLLELARSVGLYGTGQFTTQGLAEKLDVSQQTVSNTLRKLEEEKLIARAATYSGTEISITGHGREYLGSYVERIQKLMKSPGFLKGRVFTGMQEGGFYISQNRYRKQFVDKLGIDPYPGTLNLRVDPLKRKMFLQKKTPMNIEGFVSRNRTFGRLKCYMADVHGIKSAITVPERTHYTEDTVELISNKNLRKALKLKDGSKVTIQ